MSDLCLADMVNWKDQGWLTVSLRSVITAQIECGMHITSNSEISLLNKVPCPLNKACMHLRLLKHADLKDQG